MSGLFRKILFVLLLSLLPGAGQSAAASTTEVLSTEAGRDELVAAQKYVFWQKINAARRNPLAVLDRLAIPRQQARAALGADAALLEQGLPPLAWNDLLVQAASQHSRDMIDNLYYSHFSPNGFGPMERIAETGYQAAHESEALGILAFNSPIELEQGVALILDNLMRDELTGAEGVTRNIFSPEVTEVGISFLAETLELLADQPFVYLLVADFARPLMPRQFVIGEFDVDGRVAMMPFVERRWRYLELLQPELFQVRYPEGGALVIVVKNTQNRGVLGPIGLYDQNPRQNRYVDFRTGGQGP